MHRCLVHDWKFYIISTVKKQQKKQMDVEYRVFAVAAHLAAVQLYLTTSMQAPLVTSH